MEKQDNINSRADNLDKRNGLRKSICSAQLNKIAAGLRAGSTCKIVNFLKNALHKDKIKLRESL